MLGAAQQIVSGKICAKCGYLKSLEKFCRNTLNKDGLHSYCKECVNSMVRGIYRRKTGRTIEEIEGYKAGRLIKIVDGKKTCNICGQWKLISCFIKNNYQKSGLNPSCKNCDYKRLKVYRFKETKRIKLICMMGYGGCCQCCGEHNIELLTVEHIRGKGITHIRESNSVMTMKKLIELGFPEGHTCLCYNCNLSSIHFPCTHSSEYNKYVDKYITPYPYSNQKELNELENKWNTMNSGVLPC